MALGRTDSFHYSSPRDTGFFARGTAAYHRRMAEPVAGPRHTNRLAGETSPYLLQHAHNPVDWIPWGPEALARAKLLDRPIFLSIGYAACHWCHVMERESFEDEATAAELNARFVAIKVDREERPDLDQLYMGAVQTMTGGGGWPMSVFLTPEGRPFYGGTYFPDTPRHGMPSFRQVLEGVPDRVDDAAAGGRAGAGCGSSTRWSSRRRSGPAAGPSGCRRARRSTPPPPRSRPRSTRSTAAGAARRSSRSR